MRCLKYLWPGTDAIYLSVKVPIVLLINWRHYNFLGTVQLVPALVTELSHTSPGVRTNESIL